MTGMGVVFSMNVATSRTQSAHVFVMALMLALALVASPHATAARCVQTGQAENEVVPVAQCHYYRNVSRFNTCTHGAVADEAAVVLYAHPSDTQILIDASATDDEKLGIEIRRAERARDYLVYEKLVDPDRIVLRWSRVSRKGVGKWGGSMRIVAIRGGALFPDFVEGDLNWQLTTR